MNITRSDRSSLALWWWTIDRWTLGALALLLAFGSIMSLAATPSVAERINLDSLHFVRRHFVFLAIGIIIKLLAIPSTHTHPTAGLYPATNIDLEAASTLLTSN